jgi:hypothetical protein
MAKGDRANLERLLRTAWEKQTALLAKPAISNKEPKPKLRLDYSMALGVFVMGIIFIIFPPTTALWAGAWIIILTGMAIYPILHFWVWSLKHRNLANVFTLASVLLMGSLLFHHLRPVFYPIPSLSFQAVIAPTYHRGMRNLELLGGMVFRISD